MHFVTTARALATAALILFAACGGKGSNEGAQAPAESPSTAPAEPAAPMTREDCEKQGGRVAGDIGDGKIQCNEGEKELGRVTFGIEGGVCCAPSGPGAAPAGAAGW